MVSIHVCSASPSWIVLKHVYIDVSILVANNLGVPDKC
jgi:hypothetical protein